MSSTQIATTHNGYSTYAGWVVFKCHSHWNGKGDFVAGVIKEATTKAGVAEAEIKAALDDIVGTYIIL